MKTLFAMLTVCCVVGWGYAQEALSLPELEAVPLDGPLAVVATTSIIGDVVARVGGEAIALTTLMGLGQDPHGYQPAARDLATAIFVAVFLLTPGRGLVWRRSAGNRRVSAPDLPQRH